MAIITPISAPISISLSDHLTPEEREQIFQTVEMFEVITQANPDDYQSLEILKEAYWKIGKQQEGLAVTRKLADTYMRLGQYSSALLEYEGILQQEPDSDSVQKVLAELESKLHHGKSATTKAAIALDFGIDLSMEPEAPPQPPPTEAKPSAKPAAQQQSVPAAKPVSPQEQASLMTTVSTQGVPAASPRRAAAKFTLDTDGNEPLAKFLIQHRLASHEIVNASLATVRQRNSTVKEVPTVAASLLDEISKAGVDIETLLSAIIDRTKFAYAPLEYYDVDRQIVKMLPENVTLGRIVVPFDIVSRTMMIAVDNPFDAAAKAAVQQSVDYHIQWHLAQPANLIKILRETYKIA